MIRKLSLNLDNSNTKKAQILLDVLTESKYVINFYIQKYWNFNGKLNINCLKTEYLNCETWFSKRLQQNCAKQALGIVKSIRSNEKRIIQKNLKRKKPKTLPSMPIFNGNNLMLSETNIEIQFGENSFDFWIKFYCLGRKLQILIPTKSYDYLQKYIKSGWILKKSASLNLRNGKLFLDVIFEKEAPQIKVSGKIIGIDIGCNKLVATSEKEFLGTEFKQIVSKLTRKLRGSKSYNKALKERNDYINFELKKLELGNLQTIVLEDLKYVKYKSKLPKFMNNKLQYWVYPKIVNKISQLAEESGVQLTFVNPAFTSQKCIQCGVVDPKNRANELFSCINCQFVEDADFVGSINILQRFLGQENMVPGIKSGDFCNVL